MCDFKNFGFIKPWARYVLTTLILLCCFGQQSSYAINYYFSSTRGNDAYTSKQARNMATPWKSLRKLNTIIKTLKGGDAVYFKRGDIFEGSITVNASGINNLPIVFGAYGTGNKPIINGLKQFYNWQSVGNGIYQDNWLINVTQVIINNKQQAMGRYPNEGYLTYQSHIANLSIVDTQIDPDVNLTGAEIVIRKNRWIIDKSLITSHIDNMINYATGTNDEPTDGYGYFIQKSEQTLDQVGEWYFNEASKKMMVFFGNQHPDSFIVKSSIIDTLVRIKGFNNIRFENLAFIGAGVNAFQISNSKNISLDNCSIDFTGEQAISATYSPFLKINNVWVNNSLCRGINLDLGCTDAQILNSTIKNTGVIAGMGKSGPGTYEAITCFGDRTLIEKNTIDSTGHNGIYFGGNSSTAKNNLVKSFCLTKDDGAGIYIGDWSETFNKRVIGNIIINGVGNSAGTNNKNSLQAEGIYVDDLSQSVSIEKNTISQCANNGIKIHNAKDINILDNLVYNNGVQLRLEQDHYIPTSTYIRNNNIKRNIFFCENDTQLAAKVSTHLDDIIAFGTLDSNAYCSPFNESSAISATWVKDSSFTTQSYDLATWKTAYGKDASSTKSPRSIPAQELSNTLGNNKFLNENFDTTVDRVYNYSVINDCSQSLSNGLLDGGALELNFESPVNNHVMVNFLADNIEAGKNYVLRFSALGNLKDQLAQLYLRKSGYPYNIISDIKSCKIDSSRTENEVIFMATADDSDASILIDIEQPTGSIHIDNVSLFEATIKKNNPKDYLVFEYNAENYTKTIPISKSYVDINNKIYTDQIVLEPYTSIVLIVAEPAKTPQTIVFTSDTSSVIIDNVIAVTPIASSGLPVTLKVLSGPATITKNNLVKFNATGTVKIEATQKGDAKYQPVTLVTSIVNTGKITTAVNDFVLKAYPNPFQSQLSLELTMPTASTGTLMLYDMHGRMISETYKGYINANESKTFTINADDLSLSAGTYILRLVTDKKAFFQKVMYIK